MLVDSRCTFVNVFRNINVRQICGRSLVKALSTGTFGKKALTSKFPFCGKKLKNEVETKEGSV